MDWSFHKKALFDNLMIYFFYVRHTSVSSVVKAGVQDQGDTSWEGGEGAEQSLFQLSEGVGLKGNGQKEEFLDWEEHVCREGKIKMQVRRKRKDASDMGQAFFGQMRAKNQNQRSKRHRTGKIQVSSLLCY